ncbi:hypothetical protein CROQUDRAFT_87842 [Cronartium quercuum f. sp. fusiforme G11]|uniref:Uncharacterized protein n=1 Tax=Cronartium quercuum f. sp. fusiforme G11 TaxID=708437 RepID=A0A9P6NW83_9BASI|nr:hypothetical protein CROQUDRAFT_87842 [Cronartium quercuum f. sp. fusiforme G11]
MKSSLMTMCGLVIQSFFLHSPHLVLASASIAPVEVRPKTTLGFFNEHNSLAFKSAPMPPKQSRGSLLRRRFFRCCFGEGRRSVEGSPTREISEAREFVEGSLTQEEDRKHIAYALHEEAIVEFAKNQESLKPWFDFQDGPLSILHQIATSRRRLIQFGGSEEIKQYLRETKLPSLFVKFAESAEEKLLDMNKRPNTEENNQRFYLLRTLLEAELQDSEFSERLNSLDKRVTYVRGSRTFSEDPTFENSETIPVFQPQLTTEEWDQYQRSLSIDFEWMVYQLKAQRYYGHYLTSRQNTRIESHPISNILSVYGPEKLDPLFTKRGGTKPLDPKSYALDEFMTMQERDMNSKRLIEETKALGLRLVPGETYAQLNPRIAFLPLAIESIYGPYSKEAFGVLSSFSKTYSNSRDSQHLTPIIEPYLNLARKYQDRSESPPRHLTELIALNPDPVSPATEAGPSSSGQSRRAR